MEIPILTVTFDAQGGTAPSPSATTVTNGLTYGALSATTRVGFTFAGWYTAVNGGGTEVTPSTTVTITAAQTLYAKWTLNAISTVTFDAQGGTVPSPSTATVTNGLTYGTLATTTRAGYTFAGWYPAVNGGGTEVTSGTTVTITSEQTLYAKWTVNAVSTVTFDAQSGTTPIPSTTTVTNGLTYGALATTTRAGYTFAGWYTAVNGGGTQVTSVTTVTVESAQTLYAKWSVDVKNLVLQSNGGVLESFTSQYDNNLYAAANLTDGAVGSGGHNWVSAVAPPPGPQTFEYSFAEGQSAKVTSLALVNATQGYNAKDFELWVSADNSSWEKIKEGVLADIATPQTFDLGSQIAKRARLVITSGYSPVAWELAEFELRGYYVEPVPSYTVTFDAQGGTMPVPTSKSVISNMTYEALATTTRAGYTFAGWYTAVNGGGTEVTPSTAVTITAAQTLYAKWTLNAVSTVTFDAQSGTTPLPSATTVTNGLTYGALATTTRIGYMFAGWWTGSGGTGTEVTSGTTVTITSAQTLYAKWSVDVRNLVLQANGGVLESFTSQYDNVLYAAANLTDGAVGSGGHNWVSAVVPPPGPQTFEYSFAEGQSAKVTSLTLVNATQAYNAKNFELWVSADGSAWEKIKEGVLADIATPQVFDLGSQIAKRARLVITSGYSPVGWELAEFELYGYYDAPLRPADVWYTAHGITPGPNETWQDLDSRIMPGKLMTLWQEYVADTDPNDTNSVFRVLTVDPGPPAVLRFVPASTGRVYTLQYTDDLASGIWSNVVGAERHVGSGGEDSLSDDNAPVTGGRFYRMKVDVP
jgi:uncharacterized repeat protein (TIGR02543 family)